MDGEVYRALAQVSLLVNPSLHVEVVSACGLGGRQFKVAPCCCTVCRRRNFFYSESLQLCMKTTIIIVSARTQRMRRTAAATLEPVQQWPRAHAFGNGQSAVGVCVLVVSALGHDRRRGHGSEIDFGNYFWREYFISHLWEEPRGKNLCRLTTGGSPMLLGGLPGRAFRVGHRNHVNFKLHC